MNMYMYGNSMVALTVLGSAKLRRRRTEQMHMGRIAIRATGHSCEPNISCTGIVGANQAM